MKLPTKFSTLVVVASIAAASLAMGPGTAVAGSGDVAARPGAPDKPKVVTIRSTDRKVTMSDQHFRPGVTEFRVTSTAKKGSSLAIVQSDDLSRVFQKFGTAFSGGPGSADAMKAIDRLATFYGGGGEGTRWQVKLSQNSYYLVDTATNKLTTFKVKGDRRTVKMQSPDSEVWATKQNQFQISGKLRGDWVAFDNRAREIHFLGADPVAQRVTGKDVREALMSPKQPKWLKPGGFHLEIQSPGVTTVYRENVKDSKYLLTCFMPSEEQDGVAHAMMGMWRLVAGV